MHRNIVLLAAVSLMSICTLSQAVATPPPPPTPAAAPTPPPPATPQSLAHEALNALFIASDEASLKRNPLQALSRGDMRYADQLGDLFSDAASQANYEAALGDMAALKKMDRATLSSTDQTAYDVFQWQTALQIKASAPAMRKLFDVRPIDHFGGIQTQYPSLASGQGPAPFKTVKDYEDNISRNAQYAAQIDVAIARLKEGAAAGVTNPKLTMQRVVEQLNTQLKMGFDASPFALPTKSFPANKTDAEKARLTAATRASVEEKIFPAYRRLIAYLTQDYIPKAHEKPGLIWMKGGAQAYALDIEANTTLPLSAAAVHETGLKEVARITAEMMKVKQAMGFKGDMHAFFEYLRTDARFKPKSREWLHDGYEAIKARVLTRIPEQFSTTPKTPLDIVPEPDFREKTAAGGEYEPGTPDGAVHGKFYYNAYDLPSRLTFTMETLFLHEAIPGHHFQISLAQENDKLPNFMRFGGNTAYVEGWALYAESL